MKTRSLRTGFFHGTQGDRYFVMKIKDILSRAGSEIWCFSGFFRVPFRDRETDSAGFVYAKRGLRQRLAGSSPPETDSAQKPETPTIPSQCARKNTLSNTKYLSLCVMILKLFPMHLSAFPGSKPHWPGWWREGKWPGTASSAGCIGYTVFPLSFRLRGSYRSMLPAR